MRAYSVVSGGLGQTSAVTSHDVVTELQHRGYAIEVHAPAPTPTPTAPTLTKHMAISVAVDEAITRLRLPRTASHPYRCPTRSCPISQSTWTSIVSWCVTVANGYLSKTYNLPSWAQSALNAGQLHGVALGGLGNLGGFSDWLQENPWFVKSVGDGITNYGEHLTAKNVQDAIKANTAQALSKDDALALVAALQQGGYVPQGKTQTVAQGASMAASPSWLMPAMIGGGVLLVLLLMKK